MKQGKISESVLDRAVIRQIRSTREQVTQGAAKGADYASLQPVPGMELVYSSQVLTECAADIGREAVQIALNNAACAGAAPQMVLMDVLLPDHSVEQTLKEIMHGADVAARELGVQIAGGHTTVTSHVDSPVITVTGIGCVPEGQRIPSGGAKPGMDILMTKEIALYGTAILAKRSEPALREHFPEHLVREAQSFTGQLPVFPEAKIAASYGAAALHDASEGGIYAALWDLCEASGVGCEVDLKSLRIRQETVEITEYLGVNPYKLHAGGSLLIAALDGAGLLAKLHRADIPAAIIGRTTGSADRLLYADDERRYLERPQQDELYHALTAGS